MWSLSTPGAPAAVAVAVRSTSGPSWRCSQPSASALAVSSSPPHAARQRVRRMGRTRMGGSSAGHGGLNSGGLERLADDRGAVDAGGGEVDAVEEGGGGLDGDREVDVGIVLAVGGQIGRADH